MFKMNFKIYTIDTVRSTRHAFFAFYYKNFYNLKRLDDEYKEK